MLYRIVVLLFTSQLLLLGGCSSILSLTTDKPLEEDETERTTGSFFDDHRIETRAKVNLKKVHPDLKNSHIVVVSYNGIVLLAGQVPSQEMKQLAGETVKKIRKVRRLNNELTVAGSSSTLARTSDTWLTAKVKSRLLFNAKIKSGEIKVVTENGVVYLMGLITRADAERVVQAVQKSSGVQKIVKIFEYVD